MSFAFIPATGLNDVTQFPDEDPLIRSHMQTLLQQIPTYIDTFMAPKLQESVIAPTLLNAWVNTGGVNAPAGYYKDSFGIVHLRGQVKDGANTSIFFLPSGYLPLLTEHFAVLTQSGIGEVYIQSDGQVIFYSGSNAWVSLSGITFRAGA